MIKEEFIVVSPKNECVKRFIPYYYFYKTFDIGYYRQFYYYPHYRIGLTVQKDSYVIWDDTTRITKPEKGKTTVLLTKNIKSRRIAVDYGIVNRICIALEPLGINQFIEANLNSITTGSLSYFDSLGEEFLEVCEVVFNTPNVDLKISHLDAFFLRKYTPFNDIRVIQAVELLLDNSENLSIQKLAERVCVSRKTLNRLFQKHLCCSPQTLKENIKFRKAFNQYKNQEVVKSLTHLAYDNQYYDQSEFINHVKKLTGLPPKSLFSNTKRIGPFDIYWTIKDRRLSQITN